MVSRLAYLVVGICAGFSCLAADVCVRARDEVRAPMRRSVIGVNHLAYGKNGYGLLLPGRHAVDPELLDLQKKIGFGSLRYPGGCGGTHSFQWKKNAGLDGKYHVLGVVEFMEMCENVGADPIMGISSHRGTPEEAAEYVEFLNALADEAHPWAKRRAERGHPKPYGVRYFEYGNETYHGTHPNGRQRSRRISPQEYAENYLKFSAAMKAVDGSIRLGAVLTECGSGWNRRVIELLGERADFFIRHTYCASPERSTDADYLTLFVNRRDSLRKMIANQVAEIGRDNVELAITEFNTTVNAHRTLTAALLNLETLMTLAEDRRVVHADYWQFVNEGFGMVRGTLGNYVKRPNAWAFELYSRYTLDEILSSTVEDKRVQSACAVSDDPEIVALLGTNFAANITFRYPGGNKNTGTTYVKHEDGTHELRFLDDRAMNFYHLQAYVRGLPKGDRCNWKISCRMRVEGMKGEDVNLDVTDGRGWSATHSAAALPAVGCPDWIEVSTLYSPLVDNKGSLIVRFRRDGGAGAGSAFVRDLRIEPVLKKPPSESAIEAQVSRSKDGGTATVVLLNRSLSAREVDLDVSALRRDSSGFLKVSAEALVGAGAYSTNEEDAQSVRLVPLEAVLSVDHVRLTLPPHAAAGVKLN